MKMYCLSDICSLCLVRDQNLTNIVSQDADGTVVEEKLRTFLLELIHFKPNIPKYICNNCLTNLNIIHKFRQSCLQNITTLNKYVEKLEAHGLHKNLSVSLTAIKDEKDPLEIENQNNSKTFESEIQKIYLQHNIFVKNALNKDETKESKHEFHENTIFMEENQTNAPEDVIKTEIDETQKGSLKDINIGNQENGNMFNNFHNMSYEVFKEFNEEKHIVEENGNISSNNNTKSVGSKKEVRSRKQTSEKRRKKHYKCKNCQKWFTTLNQLEIHNRFHIDKHTYKCTTCSKTFKRFHHLETHTRTHSGEKPFSCDICHKAFNQQSHYIAHKRIHSNDRPYKCSICSKGFTVNSALTRHMRTHTGEKPFHCQLCQHKCTTGFELKLHVRTHTREKPYHCHLCEYKFPTKSHLTRHLRTHTGDKPYHCHLCPYKSTANGNLKIHMRKHSGVNSDT